MELEAEATAALADGGAGAESARAARKRSEQQDSPAGKTVQEVRAPPPQLVNREGGSPHRLQLKAHQYLQNLGMRSPLVDADSLGPARARQRLNYEEDARRLASSAGAAAGWEWWIEAAKKQAAGRSGKKKKKNGKGKR
jgi:hypothetical protein